VVVVGVLHGVLRPDADGAERGEDHEVPVAVDVARPQVPEGRGGRSARDRALVHVVEVQPPQPGHRDKGERGRRRRRRRPLELGHGQREPDGDEEADVGRGAREAEVVVEHVGELRDRHDHHEVEEQLEPGRVPFALGLGVDAERAAQA